MTFIENFFETINQGIKYNREHKQELKEKVNKNKVRGFVGMLFMSVFFSFFLLMSFYMRTAFDNVINWYIFIGVCIIFLSVAVYSMIYYLVLIIKDHSKK
ncbi:MAG TPA: hypothetical protein DEB09_01570 [Candidatus Magasanikbacteria bacterium]|nr:hypothetical protein [Candidatus Magasanikbacteria bacterium]